MAGCEVQSLDGDQIHIPSKEIFEIKGKVHEVAEGRLLELHQYIDVAGFLLLSAGERAEDANPLYCEAGLDSLMWLLRRSIVSMAI